MTPSVLARQLQDNLLDYISATLDVADERLDRELLDYLRGPQGLFKGPYLRLGLPFETAPDASLSPLTIGPSFPPYAHQLQAFQQLSSQDLPSNTLVTTGTGSGKTECFLYPILDHVHRNRHRAGVQAILLYPMNALATDQARRFAEAVHEDERLHGLRVGLYVGGEGETKVMSPERVIEHKRTLREQPPHILLTNYKMLDFMLVRPDERGLWSQNGPDTLRYLVIDELHTFDGAQGSDVACLIRRLKQRLGTPEGELICAGTSATIGSSTDPETFRRLAEFASTVFGEPFEPAAVVRERRQSREDFLAPPTSSTLPQLDDTLRERLRPGSGQDAQAWLRSQMQLWMGGVLAPEQLGERLRAHPLLHHLLALAAKRPLPLPDIVELLVERMPEWRRYDEADRGLLLDSFLALVSHARRPVGSKLVPLVTLQLQLWTRELRRLLRALPRQSAGALQPSRFAWWTELPGSQDLDGYYGVQALCRECGCSGLAAVQGETEKAQSRLEWRPGPVGQAWLESHRSACFIWPRPLDAAQREGELVYWLEPDSGTLAGRPPVDEDGQVRAVPVLLEQTLKGKTTPRFARRCPNCESDDALMILGARAASLSSVVVSQLFQSPFNADKKLLAFTDSVQDASHRAGFFGGRSFRFHLRTAMQGLLHARGELRLDEAGDAFVDHWVAQRGPRWTMAAFLPPDLRELPELERWIDKGGKGQHKRLWKILRSRIGWEFTREFGLVAGLGRSLERSGAATLGFDAERLAAAQEHFSESLAQQDLLGESSPAHFLYGLLHRLRQQGGIHHPLLDEYAQELGNPYLLSKRKNEHISPFHPRMRKPGFWASRGRHFDAPWGKSAHLSWFGDWCSRGLGLTPSTEQLARVMRLALDVLEQAELLERRVHGGVEIWGLRPDALVLTTELGAVVLDHRRQHLALAEAQACDGQPSWLFRAARRLLSVPSAPGYYAQVYGRGQSERVFPGEHTGLLDRQPRTELEQRFLRGATDSDPQAPNLLVCTPTLEMGVDIGDLSATLLCSVPPGPANYLQRIGRAGRKTGNALVFTLATSQPHDLYFHAEPERMLDGIVEPPGVFLGAVAMLRRQLTAWCMDHWAQEDEGASSIPVRTALCLGEGARSFPGRFVDHLLEHRERLLAGFLETFDQHVTDEAQPALEAWVRSELTGIQQAVPQAFLDIEGALKEYAARREKARKRMQAIQDDPTSVGDAQQELKELKRYRIVLSELMAQLRSRYPLNVLASASLLPNYAFPESGVWLHSLLGGTEQDEQGQDKRVYRKRAYLRPAARALRELAPFNTFYADGHKVTVRQLELGPKARHVEHWRFCPSCPESRQAVDPAAPATEPSCPRCGHAGWADKGQIRPMLKMSTVRSISDRVRSTTIDDTEERQREAYQVAQLFQVDGVAGAWLIRDLGFGFEYAEDVTLTELNLGLRSQVEGAPKLDIAGEACSALAFLTCPDCGSVFDTRDPRNGRQHTPFCPQRGKDSKAPVPLTIYRRVRSEALRLLLPVTEVAVEEKLRSLQAALHFGLRRRFHGQPIHLQVGVMNEPVPNEPDARKHFLVLFDSVPGGTGYLREYRQGDEVRHLLQETVDGLRGCRCRTIEGRDGCSLCLFGRQSQRYLPVLSSTLAENILDEVLGRWEDAEHVPALGPVGVDAVLESELEERFMATLEARADLELKQIAKGQWELRAEDSLWQVLAQQDVSAEAGQPSRADFLLVGLQGPAVDQKVVVECDGFAYHACPGQPQSRLTDDVRKRVALMSRPGWRVFSIAWADVDPSKQPGRAPAALAMPAEVWGKVANQARSKLPPPLREELAGLPERSSLELLVRYLSRPLPEWDLLAATLCCGALVGALATRRAYGAFAASRLRQALTEDAVLQVPAVEPGITGRNEPVAGFSREEQLACLVQANSQRALVGFDPHHLDVHLRLDDRAECRTAGFVEPWKRFLLALNVLQFLPGLEVWTSGLAEEEGGTDVLSQLGLDSSVPLAAEHVEEPVVLNLQRVIREGLDQDLEVLVRALRAGGLPSPDPEPAEVQGLPTELSWTAHRLAVCRPEDLEGEDEAVLKSAGWTVIYLPMPLRDLMRSLRHHLKGT